MKAHSDPDSLSRFLEEPPGALPLNVLHVLVRHQAPCNVYDTARETGGSSSGSAASVGANLVSCSICEETGGSCRQPAWRNGVVGFVTTKGLLPYGGAIGVEPYLDRAGIHCRTVGDTARVLDAIRQPDGGYYDPRDIYSALPRGLVSAEPYASFLVEGESTGRDCSPARASGSFVSTWSSIPRTTPR